MNLNDQGFLLVAWSVIYWIITVPLLIIAAQLQILGVGWRLVIFFIPFFASCTWVIVWEIKDRNMK